MGHLDKIGSTNFVDDSEILAVKKWNRTLPNTSQNMKQDITKYILECDICGRVKADHMRTPGFLQPLSIPVWKWDDISIDFIVGLPRAS